MASRVATMNELELSARARWLAGAAHEHFGRCRTCGRTHDDDGGPLYVARQRRSRIFECLSCWDGRQ